VDKPEILSDEEILAVGFGVDRLPLAALQLVAQVQRDDTYRKTLERVIEWLHTQWKDIDATTATYWRVHIDELEQTLQSQLEEVGK